MTFWPDQLAQVAVAAAGASTEFTVAAVTAAVVMTWIAVVIVLPVSVIGWLAVRNGDDNEE